MGRAAGGGARTSTPFEHATTAAQAAARAKSGRFRGALRSLFALVKDFVELALVEVELTAKHLLVDRVFAGAVDRKEAEHQDVCSRAEEHTSGRALGRRARSSLHAGAERGAAAGCRGAAHLKRYARLNDPAIAAGWLGLHNIYKVTGPLCRKPVCIVRYPV